MIQSLHCSILYAPHEHEIYIYAGTKAKGSNRQRRNRSRRKPTKAFASSTPPACAINLNVDTPQQGKFVLLCFVCIYIPVRQTALTTQFCRHLLSYFLYYVMELHQSAYEITALWRGLIIATHDRRVFLPWYVTPWQRRDSACRWLYHPCRHCISTNGVGGCCSFDGFFHSVSVDLNGLVGD